MKPGDHPDFYRLAPPPGASRESSIRIDGEGRFWHDGARVDHPALEAALRSWVTRHPDNGRAILSNGYDWCYFTVDDAPLFVAALGIDEGGVTLKLTDGTEEPLDPEALRIGMGDVVYARARGLDAKFTRHAQTQLAPILVNDDPPEVVIGGKRVKIGSTS